MMTLVVALWLLSRLKFLTVYSLKDLMSKLDIRDFISKQAQIGREILCPLFSCRVFTCYNVLHFYLWSLMFKPAAICRRCDVISVLY